MLILVRHLSEQNGWIDDDGNTTFIDDDGNTTFVDENGIEENGID